MVKIKKTPHRGKAAIPLVKKAVPKNTPSSKNKLSPKNRIKHTLPLIYLVVAIFALRWTIVEPFVVPTGSMEPTLKPGDRLYALKCAYTLRFPFTEWVLFQIRNVKRGDVILFRNPQDPSITFVKRAIGLPGDTIDYENGVLFVNGKEVPRELAPNRDIMYDISRKEDKSLYLETLHQKKHYLILDNSINENRVYQELEMGFRHVVVPTGHLFAVGDNRDNSYDSRAWGFVPIQNLKGQAMFIWFSSWHWKVRPERIGTVIQ